MPNNLRDIITDAVTSAWSKMTEAQRAWANERGYNALLGERCIRAPIYSPGDVLRCLDATDGAHFLKLNECYRVREVRAWDGWLLLQHVNGDFMVRMWEPQRFALVREAVTA